MLARRILITALAAFGLTAQAEAGSVSQPGQTIGLAVGAPVPDGLYFINTSVLEDGTRIRVLRMLA